MAAITKRLLHLRPTFYSLARPYPHTQHHFSSSSDRNDDVPQSEQPETQSSDSPNLDAIRASLRNQSPPPDRRQPFASSGGARRQPPRPNQGASYNEIGSMLAEFRSRAAPPPPAPPSQHSGGGYVSMQELYEKRVNSNADGAGGRRSLDSIRESLSKLPPNGAGNPGGTGSFSFSLFTEKLGNRADPNAGGNVKLSPFSMEKKKGKGGVGVGSGTMGYGKSNERLGLGEKLMKMRPEKRKGKWFSLQELSDRLAKVRMADQDELKKVGIPVAAITESIKKIAQDKEEKDRARSLAVKQIGLLGSMAGEAGPPKDQLVDKYFHPDNMSSAEKMKLELQNVRDEFKMSESDCGSARVQVAQLTTKIKHLSAVLHKKDKHSRKGLHEMVQRRKKLLKYLRRTDWDSYCFVLSKLGLRDNPDMKA